MAHRISLFLASFPTRSRVLLRLRGRLAYKSPGRARLLATVSSGSLSLCGVVSCWNPVAVKMASTSRLVRPADPGSLRGGWGVPGHRRGCRAWQSAPGIRERRPDGLADADKGSPKRRGCQGCRGAPRAVGVTAPES